MTHARPPLSLRLWTTLVLLVAAALPLLAQPNASKVGAGTAGSTFHLGSTTGRKTQLLYTGSDLAGSVAGVIDTLYFMHQTASSTNTLTNLTVYMGQTAATGFSGSTFFTGLTHVFASASFVIPAGAVGDWFAIPLQSPFNYDPGQSLVVETNWQGSSNTSFSTRYGTSVSGKKVYASDTLASSGTASSTWQNVGLYIRQSNQLYVSSTAIQPNTSPVIRGTADNEVIGIQVVMDGSLTPLAVTQFALNTTGTTSTANISNAKIWYTGTSPTFATTTQFGSTFAAPSGAFNISGTQSLSSGTNYFWLTYDVAAGAAEYNVIDGQCTAVTVADTVRTPSVTSPAGNRTIRAALAGTKTIGPAGTYTTFTAAVADLNAVGVGSGGVTFSVTDAAVFNESPIRITATGTASNPIVFKRSTALEAGEPVLNVTGTSGTTDAAISIVGGDYITFNGIDVRNAGTSSTDWIEFGFFLHDSSGLNGCQNNTVRNCLVTLDTANNGTRGVFVYSNAAGPAGLNSNNSFIGNTITMSHNGYYLDGAGTTALDDGNLISGGSVGPYGGGTSIAYGIYANYQTNLRIGNLSITNGVGNGTSALYGMYMLGANSTVTVDSCVVTSLSGGGAVYGIYASSGDTHLIEANKVGSLYSSTTTTAVMYGIYAASAVQGSIVNNMVYDLKSTQTTSTTGVIGIYPAGATGSTMNVFYNSVLLDYSAGVATNTSSAVYVTATPTLVDMRNNIFVNKTEISGGLRAVAFRKSSAVYTNLSSNRNLFYAGTPSAKNLIFYDGTNSDSTLAAYKVRIAPNDQSSITEDPPFIGGSDLHINTAVVTAIESGGGIVSTPIVVNEDIDGNKRFGAPGYGGTGTAPDIGADEFNGLGIDLVAPSIDYATFPAAPTGASLAFNGVVITDPSGVNTTAGTRPRAYYKKSSDANAWAGNTSGDNGWKYVEATGAGPFNFTLNYSLLFGGGGVAVGDIIQYFVVAQDLAGTPNVGIATGTFAVQPTSVNLTAAAFPIGGGINSYEIRPPFSGPYTIGGPTEAFGTVKEFFDSLNAGVVTGAITATVAGNVTETATASLNELAVYPPGSVFGVTIQPGGARTISGSVAGALIKLNGADNVTINGLNTGGNALAIINDKDTANTAAIWVSSLGTNLGATRVAIRNCAIQAGGNVTTSTFGIYAGGTTVSTSGTGADNDFLTIQGNTISRAYFGVYARGTSTRRLDSLVISGNVIGGTSPADYIAYRGIDVQSAEPAIITGNTLQNITLGTSVTISGIEIGQYTEGSVISGNRIHGMRQTSTSGYGAYGINVASGTSTNGLLIANNVIYDLLTDGDGTSTTYNPFGIRITGGDNHVVVFNSINLVGSFLNATTADISAAIVITSSTVGNLDLRNNAFANGMTGGAGTKAYAIYGVTGVVFGTIDRNDYYASGANAVFGYLGSDVLSLAAWQAVTTQDAASLAVDPLYNGPTNLVPQAGSPLLGAGVSIPGVTTDFNGTVRGSPPSIGAYEAGGDFQQPSVSYTALTNTTSTANRPFSGVTVADASGVNTTAGTRPRVYYKKAAHANTWVDNTSATNGWKYAEATGAGGSPFSFTIDYARLFGGSVSVGDEIQYFVVAQDLAAPPNVAIEAGMFATQPANVGLTAAAFPVSGAVKSYFISTSVSGTLSVGTGQTYPSLTGAGGVFNYLNNNVLAGNVTISVASDLTEDGTHALGLLAETGGGGYTVTVQSSAATERLISGGVAEGLIRLDGARRIALDGRVGGSGRYLRFRNTAASGPVVLLVNDAAFTTLQSCIIEGGNTGATSGLVVFSTGVTTGNDNNTITGCLLRDRTDVAGVPANLVYSAGTVVEGDAAPSAPGAGVATGVRAEIDPAAIVDGPGRPVPVGVVAAVNNSDNTIAGNEFSNYSSAGVFVAATGNGDNWVVSNNSFYNNLSTPPSTAQWGIRLLSGSTGNVISGNVIGGSAAGAGGAAWQNSGANAFIGIEASVDSNTASTITGNTVQNISKTSTSSASFLGISVTGGRALIDGNTIGHATTAGSITNNGSSTTHGIQVTAPVMTLRSTISDNLVANLLATGTGASTRVRGIVVQTNETSTNIVGNTIHHLSTYCSGTGIAAGSPVVMGIYVFPTVPTGAPFWPPNDISDNMIHDIEALNTGAYASVASGIVATNMNGSIDRNVVYNVRNLSTGISTTTPPIASGLYIRFAVSPTIIANNMFSVGAEEAGDCQFNGIWTAGADSSNEMFLAYNSVRVAGAAAAGIHSTYAFKRGDNTGTPVLTRVVLRNNALQNVRSGGTGAHVVIANQGTTADSIGWGPDASNYNVLHAANAATVGEWGPSTVNFAGWQTASASGGDASSAAGDPVFVGDTDLHILSAVSAASNAATALAGVTTDIDGEPRNGSTPDIGADEFTGSFVVQVGLFAGWNMLANPVTTAEDSVLELYSQSIYPYAFSFSPVGGYVQSGRMLNGKGYWAKMPASPAPASIPGAPRPTDSISVVQGWNLIGTVSDSVDTTGIPSVPSGIRLTPWYGYNPGYTAATVLVPGQAYWVKASAPGKFYFAGGGPSPAKAAPVADILEGMNSFVITDAAGAAQTLYAGAARTAGVTDAEFELPPAPPAGAFDARFVKGDAGMMVRVLPAQAQAGPVMPIAIQTTSTPLTFSWRCAPGMTYVLSDAVDGGRFDPITLEGEGSVVLPDMPLSLLHLRGVNTAGIPTTFGMSQNYPNPFNPVTTISYQLPQDAFVTLRVFDILGREVATLVDGQQKAGYRTAEWNAAGIASGVYFYRLDAGSFSDIRKMMVLK